MRDTFRDCVIARIRAVIEMRGLTQAKVAKASGFSASEISKWLQATEGNPDPRTPSLRQLASLASAMDTSCDYLLGLVEDPSPPTAERLRLPQRQVQQALNHVTEAAAHLRAALASDSPTASASAADTAPRDAMPSPADGSRNEDEAPRRTRSRMNGGDETL